MNYKMVSLVLLVASSGVALGAEPKPIVTYDLYKKDKGGEGIEALKNVQFKFFMDERCDGSDMVTVSSPEFADVKFFQYKLENIVQSFRDEGRKRGTILVEKSETKGNNTRSTAFATLDVSEKNIEQVLALKTARERLRKLQPNNGQLVKNMRVLGKHEVIGALDQAHFTTLYGSPYLQYKDQAGKDVRMPISEDDIKAIGQALELNRETVKALGMFFTPDRSTSTGEKPLNYNRFVDLEDAQGISKTVRMYKWFIRGGIAVSIGALLAAIYHFSQK